MINNITVYYSKWYNEDISLIIKCIWRGIQGIRILNDTILKEYIIEKYSIIKTAINIYIYIMIIIELLWYIYIDIKINNYINI